NVIRWSRFGVCGIGVGGWWTCTLRHAVESRRCCWVDFSPRAWWGGGRGKMTQ
uniref:Uncharacterized protein n=1 Tax=Petromyzon marinus TaxID=7757 RepID=S4RBI5_PETMA